MAQSQAVNAFGTTITYNGDEIGEVTDISGPGLTRDTIEVTHHKSPGMWREFIKGLKDGGEVTFTINFIPTLATHSVATGLVADFADDTDIADFAIIFPDVAGTTWSFPGIVSNFEPAQPVDAQLTSDVTIKVAGQPTLA